MQNRNKILIIAEAGVNHNGDPQKAFQLIDAAAMSGADAVKFQTFKAKSVATTKAGKAEYQKAGTHDNDSQLEMISKLELPDTTFWDIAKYCQKKNILFISSPFDLHSVDLLNAIGLEIIKIPSGEITNLPYLRRVGSLKKQVIVSTGMANLEEIGAALAILKHSGTTLSNITVMHCNTEYPTPYSDVNLSAMTTIGNKFPDVKIGYSDHTLGIEMPIAAATLGASVIEKHFTLDKTLPGPDHRASLDPKELKAMVNAVRNVEVAMGTGIKQPSESEAKNKYIVRKSIVASRPIRRGETFSVKNITTKRPGTGLSPMLWDIVLGRKAQKDFQADELIDLDL